MVRVTRFPLDAHHVRLSPDATKAAWTSDLGLHIVDSLRAPEAVVEDLAWSPDGAFVAASTADMGLKGGHRQVRWLPAYIGDPSGSTSGASFAWEPKGVWLVVADPWSGEIRRHNTEVEKQQIVCAVRDQGDPLRAPSLAVSPDGRRLAFSAMLEDHAELRVVDLPSGEPRLVTELPRTSIHGIPFWTPDSRSLGVLVVDLEAGSSGLILVRDLQGEGEILHSSELILPLRRPAFSPSGKTLAFLDVEKPDHEFTKSGPPSLALLEGGRLRRITKPGELSGDLRFLDEERLVADGDGAAFVVSV